MQFGVIKVFIVVKKNRIINYLQLESLYYKKSYDVFDVGFSHAKLT